MPAPQPSTQQGGSHPAPKPKKRRRAEGDGLEDESGSDWDTDSDSEDESSRAKARKTATTASPASSPPQYLRAKRKEGGNAESTSESYLQELRRFQVCMCVYARAPTCELVGGRVHVHNGKYLRVGECMMQRPGFTCSHANGTSLCFSSLAHTEVPVRQGLAWARVPLPPTTPFSKDEHYTAAVMIERYWGDAPPITDEICAQYIIHAGEQGNTRQKTASGASEPLGTVRVVCYSSPSCNIPPAFGFPKSLSPHANTYMNALLPTL